MPILSPTGTREMQGQPRRHTKAGWLLATELLSYETRDIQTDEHATTGSGHITELAATELTTQAVTQSRAVTSLQRRKRVFVRKNNNNNKNERPIERRVRCLSHDRVKGKGKPSVNYLAP